APEIAWFLNTTPHEILFSVPSSNPKSSFYESSNNSRSRGIRIRRRQDNTDVSVIEEYAGLGSNQDNSGSL
ncbi:MAG: hypothetical protein LC775_17740, partial [Acidobacteria bacterium]|nr:hypothetical protein [Acidobacteriota bacterium]